MNDESAEARQRDEAAGQAGDEGTEDRTVAEEQKRRKRLDASAAVAMSLAAIFLIVFAIFSRGTSELDESENANADPDYAQPDEPNQPDEAPLGVNSPTRISTPAFTRSGAAKTNGLGLAH